MMTAFAATCAAWLLAPPCLWSSARSLPYGQTRFVRMTPVGPWEFVATVLTAFLGGVTAAMWVPQCNLRASGTGGLASFLGIACPTCNKVLMLVFGGPALLAWFDPLRPWLATAGLFIMGTAALTTWRRFRAVRTGNREVLGLRGLDRDDVK